MSSIQSIDGNTTAESSPPQASELSTLMCPPCPKPGNVRFWIISGVCLLALCILLLFLLCRSMTTASTHQHSAHAYRSGKQRWMSQSSISGMYEECDGRMIVMVSFVDGLVRVSRVSASNPDNNLSQIQFALNGLPAVNLSDNNTFTIPDRNGTLYFSWDGEDELTITIKADATVDSGAAPTVTTFTLRRIAIQEPVSI